jgi:ornithine decarboxylase
LRRFFAEASGTLLCAVHGRRERRAPDGGRQLDYWISDGIYGAARRLRP